MLLLLMQAGQTATQMQAYVPSWVSSLAAWVALGFLGFVGIAILYYVFTGRIDLSGLISEPSGEASMSRFQLLVFTFVIAASLFLIIASAGPPSFPKEIPNGILVLLGISSSSYLVSKGIQHSSPEGLSGRGPQVTIKADRSETKFGGPSVQFQADVVGLTDESVTWAIDPIDFGSISSTGLYRPPDAQSPPAGPTTVTVTATAKEDVSVSDKETIKVS
jgi:hypothetical protein